MIQTKSCPRCRGDLLLEEYLGEAEFVCIQCGHRLDAPELQKPRYTIMPLNKAA